MPIHCIVPYSTYLHVPCKRGKSAIETWTSSVIKATYCTVIVQYLHLFIFLQKIHPYEWYYPFKANSLSLLL
jgi:hypothetical protein